MTGVSLIQVFYWCVVY